MSARRGPLRADAKLVVHRRMTQGRVMRKTRGEVARKAGPILLREVKDRTPYALPGTSTLHRSIAMEVNERKGWARAYSNVKYAVWVEGGRRPGARPPPASALSGWVRRAGLPPGAAFAVARAIGRRGIRGRWMFRDGGAAAVKRLAGKRVKAVGTSMRGWRRRRA